MGAEPEADVAVGGAGNIEAEGVLEYGRIGAKLCLPQTLLQCRYFFSHDAPFKIITYRVRN